MLPMGDDNLRPPDEHEAAEFPCGVPLQESWHA